MIVYNNNSKLDLIICISEPRTVWITLYTKNKKLEVGKKYLGLYTKQPFGSSSNFVETYKVFDEEKNLLGNYFAIDFLTVEENRNKKLNELLNV
mgnify:CR=1 FL=1|jgi:hypothetical protein